MPGEDVLAVEGEVMSLTVRPIFLKVAQRFVAEHHRHELGGRQRPIQGGVFAVAAVDGERIAGVAIAGRPVARCLEDGLTIEVRRVASDGTRNVCSLLYGACRRIAKAMGYERLVTYTLASEPGTSLVAAGWIRDGETDAQQWDRPSRPRQQVLVEDRVRWRAW